MKAGQVVWRIEPIGGRRILPGLVVVTGAEHKIVWTLGDQEIHASFFMTPLAALNERERVKEANGESGHYELWYQAKAKRTHEDFKPGTRVFTVEQFGLTPTAIKAEVVGTKGDLVRIANGNDFDNVHVSLLGFTPEEALERCRRRRWARFKDAEGKLFRYRLELSATEDELSRVQASAVDSE